MYNRQQEPNEEPIPPTLEEQQNFPIYWVIRQLREGRTLRVAIKTIDGFYVSAVNGGEILIANSVRIGQNQIFTLIPQGDNREKVAIQIYNGNYVTAIDGGGSRVEATSNVIGKNELFTVIGARPDKANFITDKGYIILVLTTEPRLATAYGIATGPRTRLTIIPQV